MSSASCLSNRFLVPLTAVVLAGTACNTPGRRAEKAMAICVETEDKFFSTLSTVWAEDLKKDPKSLDDLRLQFRASRTKIRTESSGDALVLRCVDYLDSLGAGAEALRDKMTGSIALRLTSPEATRMGVDAFVAAEKAKQAPLVAFQEELASAKRRVQALLPEK